MISFFNAPPWAKGDELSTTAMARWAFKVSLPIHLRLQLALVLPRNAARFRVSKSGSSRRQLTRCFSEIRSLSEGAR